MNEDQKKNLDDAKAEYEYIYKQLRFVKDVPTKGELVKGISMRARDIGLENKPDKERVFNLSAYNFTEMFWDYCPECGSKDILQVSAKGNQWKGCYRCRLILDDKKAQIRTMTKTRKPKEEPFGAKVTSTE